MAPLRSRFRGNQQAALAVDLRLPKSVDRWPGFVETAAHLGAGRLCPAASRMARRPFSITRRRPLRTGDILHFFRALLAPLHVIRYRNYEMPGKRVPQDKYGLSQ